MVSIYAKMMVAVEHDESLTKEEKWKRIFALLNCSLETQKQLEKYNKKLRKKFDLRIYLRKLGILNKIRCAYLGAEEEFTLDIFEEAQSLDEFFKQFYKA